MTKCPECGKELEPDEILIPVFDKSGKGLITCIHTKKQTWEGFIKKCEYTGKEPSEVFDWLIENFNKWAEEGVDLKEIIKRLARSGKP